MEASFLSTHWHCLCIRQAAFGKVKAKVISRESPLPPSRNVSYKNKTTMKKYPIGIQSFESMRHDRYFYVDKTEHIHRLVSTGRYYFLSRPRRFGKSLLLSTIKAFFEGKRELFSGLAIDSLTDEWTPRPILYLDLNSQKYDTPESLDHIIDEHIAKWETLYGRNEAEIGQARRFNGIIRRAHERTGHRVVILVDEYDKPMLQAIGNDPLQEAFRNTLKAFYGALKSCDEHIRFTMLTGVTKFGKVSVFSDLNNLNDISMSAMFHDICGISERELEANFAEDIGLLARAQEITEEQCRAKLKEMFDGYHFECGTPGVYNPFSLLNTFYKMKFGSYWFETGTPTFLVKLLRLHNYNLNDMDGLETTADVLNSIDAASTNPIPVIYQSGYLTIKGHDKVFDTYTLGFPNREVEVGFIKYLMPFYTPVSESKSMFEIKNFTKEVERGDADAFMARLASFFADIPYELQRDLEVHYQNVLFIVFRLLGFYTEVEYRTAAGRVDLVLKTPGFIYVMEFKLNGTAEEAITQINERGYAAPFAADPRKVIKLGVGFSSKLKSIEKWIVEE